MPSSKKSIFMKKNKEDLHGQRMHAEALGRVIPFLFLDMMYLYTCIPIENIYKKFVKHALWTLNFGNIN